MKYLIVLLIFIGATATAQRINFYPDSVRIELPKQKSVVVFEMKEYKKDTLFIKNFPGYLKEILAYVKKSSPIMEGPHRIEVRLVPVGEKQILSMGGEHTYAPIGEKTIITIQKVNQLKTQATIKDKQIIELLPPGWELSILSDNNKVTMYSESFISMAAVDTLDFAGICARLLKEFNLKSIGKSSIQSRMVYQNNKIEQAKFVRKYPGDQIALGVSGGVGVFRDRIYPQLSATVSLKFNDRFSRPYIRTSATIDFLFFTERTTEGFQMNTNQFVSLSIEKNFNRKTKGAQWSGIGVGLLTNKSGDYFTGKTMKFFINHDFEKGVSIVPEFYLTDDFKKFTFGTTIRYRF